MTELEREVRELRAKLGAPPPPPPPLPHALQLENENALLRQEALLAARLQEVQRARRLQQQGPARIPVPQLPGAGEASPCPIPLLVLEEDVPQRYRWLARAHCLAQQLCCLLIVALSLAGLLADSPWQRCLRSPPKGSAGCMDPTLASAVPLALAAHEAAVGAVVLLWRLAWPGSAAPAGAASPWDALPLLRATEGARANAWCVEGTPAPRVLEALLRRQFLRLLLLPGALVIFCALPAALVAAEYGEPLLPGHAAVAARAAVAAAGALLAWALPAALRAQWAAEFGAERQSADFDAQRALRRCSELVTHAVEFDAHLGGAAELAADLVAQLQHPSFGPRCRVRLRFLGSTGSVHVVELGDFARWLAAGQLTGGLGVAAPAAAPPAVGLPVEIMPLVQENGPLRNEGFAWVALPHPLLAHWGRPAAVWQPPSAARLPQL